MNFIAPLLIQRLSIGSDTPKLFHMCTREPKQLALPPRLVIPCSLLSIILGQLKVAQAQGLRQVIF